MQTGSETKTNLCVASKHFYYEEDWSIMMLNSYLSKEKVLFNIL